MQTATKHKLDLGYPVLDGIRFGLTAFIVLLKVIREVAVQIKATRIVTARNERNAQDIKIQGNTMIGRRKSYRPWPPSQVPSLDTA